MAGFKKAVAQEMFFKAGFYGKSGSGKTLTSLLVAEGLAKKSGKRIAYVDTELGTAFYRKDVAERTVHPQAFDFDVLETRSIFEVLDALEAIDPAVHGVVVIDSMTHIWEAARAAYTGKTMSNGGIPVQAWGQIKKPYKRIMSLWLDGSYHGLICGREGVVMEEDEDGETKVVGTKMKSEGETPYEPHMLVRMHPKRDDGGGYIISGFVEKDRSGILTGKTLDWPNYATFEPVVNILAGGGQTATRLGTPEENAGRDSEAGERQKAAQEAERVALVSQIKDALNKASTPAELKAAWLLTTGKKTRLGEDNFTKLEAIKNGRKHELLEVA